VIVAGGSGVRMKSPVPKQFLELYGKPVLMHTVEAFSTIVPDARIIIVIPQEYFALWQRLCSVKEWNVKHTLAAGGLKRYDSVKNGLALVGKQGVVAIHDAVRPLVSADVVKRCFDAAATYGAAIPVVPLKDSIRKIINETSHNEDRNMLRAVQTPQCFRCSIIKEAYTNAPLNDYTDDASVAETCGHNITLVEGNEENIKITSPADMLFAEVLLKNKFITH